MKLVSTRKVTVAAAVVVLTVLPFKSALTAESRTTFAVDIDSQPLEAALVELSKQGHWQLVISTGSLPVRISLPLHGKMSVNEALNSLLKGTGLSYKFVGTHTIAIIKLPDRTGQLSEPPASSGATGDIRSGTSAADSMVDRGAGDSNVSKGDHSVKHGGMMLRIATFLGICVSAAGPSPACAREVTTSASSQMLEEVVVTAEKRKDTEQKTPLALTVVSGEEIANQGVSQPQDLSKLVPGLTITNTPITVISVRGVGTTSEFDSLAQLGVGVSTDGLNIDRVTAVAGNFFDLERVEVLLGPQGTLYGRNATGGAVNLISNKPNQTFGGNAQMELGNYNLRRVTGAINVPVSGQLALRAAFFDSKRDGYLSDGYNDEDLRAGRLHALWTPNSDVSLLMTLEASKVGGIGIGNAFESLGLVGAQSSPEANSLRRLALVPGPTGPQPIPSPSPSFQAFNNRSARAQLDWNLGFGTLTVIPGYRSQNFAYQQGTVQGGITSSGSSNQFTTEVRLANQTDKLKWNVGLYDFNEHVNFGFTAQFVFFTLLPQGIPALASVYQTLNTPNYDTKSQAAFGEMTYSFNDRFRGILGARYTTEKKTADLANQWYGEGFNIAGRSVTAISPLTGVSTNLYAYNTPISEKVSHTTGRIGIEYDLAPKSMLYATVSQGFKGGGFGLAPPPQTTYKPEYLTAYTLGVKNRFLNDSIQLNAEVYSWDYTDQQLSVVVNDIYGGLEQITVNAAKSRLSGAEVSLLWAPEAHDRLGLKLMYEHAVFGSYNVVSGLGASGNAPNGCTFTPTTYLGRNAFNEDCSGLNLPFTPKESGNASYAHTFDLGSGGAVVVGGDVHFASAQQTQVSTFPLYTEHGYAMYDASVAYQAPGKVWSVTAYGRNLGNKLVYNSPGTDSWNPAIPAALNKVSGVLPPRTVGLIIKANF
jgi:iron complex outermembrane receptor protein